jgi:hypothetical protein
VHFYIGIRCAGSEIVELVLLAFYELLQICTDVVFFVFLHDCFLLFVFCCARCALRSVCVVFLAAIR